MNDQDFEWKFPYPSRRMPVMAENVVSTSQPLASQAGLKMLRKGGNAVDAALAAAIALTVVEPTSNGIGSDAFCLLWDGKKLIGLNASGRSPAAWTPEHFSQYEEMPVLGWDATTIPGAVSAWVMLWRKYGQLEFQELFEPAIKYAERGFLVSPIIAMSWRFLTRQYKEFPEWVQTFTVDGHAPSPGTRVKFPDHAKTLQLIAKTKGRSLYKGQLADKIVEHADSTGGVITHDDLRSHEANWVDPIQMEYEGVVLHEIPPNGQGIAALMMLGILKNLELDEHPVDSIDSIHLQLEAMKLAFRDTHRYVSDPGFWEFDPTLLLDPGYLRKRSGLISYKQAGDYQHGRPKKGGTVYLTTADADGMMVSYIQSNFWAFGSGIVIPGTGIAMQNRGNGFTLESGHPNRVGPRKRPYHTIIPAFVTRNGQPLMSFGVMGGHMQPQGHAQMMVRIFKYGQNPQATIDAPRWQVTEGLGVKVENSFSRKIMKALRKRGHEVKRSHYIDFGGAQINNKWNKGYFAASESRKDGQAVGY
mgnify:CR=1 FL=1